MGGSSSKVAPDAAKADLKDLKKNLPDLQKAALQKVVDDKLIFDAHCHYTNYMQGTEGIEALTKAMAKNGVGFSSLTGTAFKKTWVGGRVGAAGNRSRKSVE